MNEYIEFAKWLISSYPAGCFLVLLAFSIWGVKGLLCYVNVHHEGTHMDLPEQIDWKVRYVNGRDTFEEDDGKGVFQHLYELFFGRKETKARNRL